MYQPKYFTENDQDAIKQFMVEHPFATLIAADESIPVATQIPVMIEDRGGQLYIQGHISRHTEHYKVLEKTKHALILFSGAHCYVSASWYSQRGQASTWDYMAVQASGKLHFLDHDGSRDLLQKLTYAYEKDQAKPELLENMPEVYVTNNVKAIVGFELAIEKLNTTFKLSQNKDEESYKNIVAQLEQTGKNGELEIAAAMKKLKPELF